MIKVIQKIFLGKSYLGVILSEPSKNTINLYAFAFVLFEFLEIFFCFGTSGVRLYKKKYRYKIIKLKS